MDRYHGGGGGNQFYAQADITPLVDLIRSVARGFKSGEEDRTMQLLRGIAFADKYGTLLSKMDKPAQQQVWSHLFTYRPNWMRRLTQGEANQTLLWPSEKEVDVPQPSKKISLNVPPSEGMQVKETPLEPPPTKIVHGPSTIGQAPAFTGEIPLSKGGEEFIEVPQPPLKRKEKVFFQGKQEVVKMSQGDVLVDKNTGKILLTIPGKTDEKDVKLRENEILLGPDGKEKARGIAKTPPWHPMTKEEAIEFEKEKAGFKPPPTWGPKSKEEYMEVHPRGWTPGSKEEYKEVHPKNWAPGSKEEYMEVHPPRTPGESKIPLGSGKYLKEELLDRFMRDPNVLEEISNLPPQISNSLKKKIENDVKSGRNTEQIMVNNFNARQQAAFSKIISIAAKYINSLGDAGAIDRAIKEFKSGLGGITQPPPTRQPQPRFEILEVK